MSQGESSHSQYEVEGSRGGCGVGAGWYGYRISVNTIRRRMKEWQKWIIAIAIVLAGGGFIAGMFLSEVVSGIGVGVMALFVVWLIVLVVKQNVLD